MNILMLLQMAAEAMGQQEAIRCGGDKLTYAQLYTAALRAGSSFQNSGTECVAWLDEAGLATPIALFGAAAAGIPYVPLNYRLTAAEIETLLERLSSPFLITGDPRVAIHGHMQSSRDFFAKSTRDDLPGKEPAVTEPDALAVQLFTSGTTGQPKAAVLRHCHLMSYVLGSVDFAGADETEAVLVTVPPYHIAGISALLSATYAGRRVVLMPAFDPLQWLQLARREQVTHAFLVPTMLGRIVEVLRQQEATTARLPALRALAYGGGKMHLDTIESAMELFPGVEFTNAYGLTETSSTITLLGPEDHRLAYKSEEPGTGRRLASVGRPLPGIEVEIRDAEGNALGPFEPGEVHVRGEQVAGEYLGRGSQLDREGWFPTRDAGYLDDAGYLFLEGRADDIIVRGAENISPGEVEDVLAAHPAVAEAAVVGIPSEKWGEAIAAGVVLRAGQEVSSETLREHVRTALRSSRVPEEIVFLEQLPYNEMGKLLRRQIKAAVMQRSISSRPRAQ
ncbi:class I adenylate-forming enzyme family protein [Haliea atlantica]